MTKAEQSAREYADKKLQAVDPELWETGYTRYHKMSVRVMDGSDVEQAYQDGYEQAEKDLSWHSVDESLPPIGEEVIVLTDSPKVAGLPRLNRIAYGQIIQDEYTKNGLGWSVPGVHHWMPCPKLPKV